MIFTPRVMLKQYRSIPFMLEPSGKAQHLKVTLHHNQLSRISEINKVIRIV